MKSFPLHAVLVSRAVRPVVEILRSEPEFFEVPDTSEPLARQEADRPIAVLGFGRGMHRSPWL